VAAQPCTATFHTATMPRPAQSPNQLNVLCFGNSLTAGFPAGQPYAQKLAETVRKSFPAIRVHTEVEGRPGDLVVGGAFIPRMNAMWAGQSHYDWTVVLGGTNDLGWGKDPAGIIDGLKKTWDIPLRKGSKVLALTIPETKYRAENLPARRAEVNRGIMAHRCSNLYAHFLSPSPST
jgi:lysophospholipase L1-like esterase